MAPRKRIKSAQDSKTDKTPSKPAPELRRSKRLQNQSSKPQAAVSREGKSKVASPVIVASNALRKTRKSKGVDTLGGKASAEPAKKNCKDKAAKQIARSKSISARPSVEDREETPISVGNKPSDKPTLNQTTFETNGTGTRVDKEGKSLQQSNDDPGNRVEGPSSSSKRKFDDGVAQHASKDGPLTKSPRLSLGSHDRSSFAREFETVREFSSVGWQVTENLSKDICCTDSVNPSRLPSPLADLGSRGKSSLHFINNHCPDHVRLLYYQIRNHSEQYRREITEAFAKEAQGVMIEYGTGTCTAYDTGNRDSGSEDDAVKTDLHVWPLDATSFEPFLGRRLSPVRMTRLEARLLENGRTGRQGHFILTNPGRLVVNESIFGQYLLAGPLPDFAIIHINHHTLFWWRSVEALDSLPPGEVLSLTGDKGGEGPPEQPSSPSIEWSDILDAGLARHRKQRRRSKRPKEHKEPHQIDGPQNLNFDSVLLAIASIWDALRSRGVIYAYAGQDVFDPDMARVEGFEPFGVVGGSRKFIMPIFMPSSQDAQKEAMDHYNKFGKKKKGTKPNVGHILLAVTQRTSDQPDGIGIDIMDSCYRHCSPDAVMNKAKALATRSGWSGHLQSQDRPRFRYDAVPQQRPGTNTCGLFTIFNAWAVMLDIPVRRTYYRGRRSEEEFLLLGQEIVNLALAGFMDSRTIQAFLNVFGLVEQQDACSVEGDGAISVDAVRMAPTRFRDALYLQKIRDNDLAWKSVTPDYPDGEKERQIPDEAIDFIRGVGGEQVTEDQAIEVLRQTDGDAEEAAGIVLSGLGVLDELSDEG